MRRRLVITVLLGILVAGVAWGISAALTTPREIVLVASGMTFYFEGDPTPNPTLRLRPGEKVRLTLINRDRGMRHDLAVTGLGTATGVLAGDGGSQTVRLRAPAQPGVYDYVCRLHVQTMRGVLEVG